MRAPWVTTREARDMTGRSARTIRRWLADGLIATKLDSDGRTRLLRTTDLMTAEANKTEYATRPTFCSQPRQM